MILPPEMDGVPGISFNGIDPGSSFRYQFDVRQSGTFWYHSHSGFQEQTGRYGAIVIDPLAPDSFSSDRDYVVLVSDWSDEDPTDSYATLKKMRAIISLPNGPLPIWSAIFSTKGSAGLGQNAACGTGCA